MSGWRLALWLGMAGAALGFLYLVRGILLPFLLAIIISVVLDPAIRKLRMRGMNRFWAVSLVMIAFFAVLTGFAVWLTPMVGGQVTTFKQTVEKVSSSIAAPDPNQNFFVRWNPVIVAEMPERQDFIDQTLKQFEPQLKAAGIPTTRKALYDRYIAPNSKQISAGVQNFFNSLFGFVAGLTSQIFLLVLTPLLIFMLLVDLERIKKRSVTWIPPAIRAQTVELISEISDVFTSYLRGMTLLVVIYMCVASLLLLLLGVQYSILIGMAAGFIYLIPYIRVFISLPILFFVSFMSGSDKLLFFTLPSTLHYAMAVCIIFFAFDASYDTLVSPRVIGKAVGLNAVVSMFVSLAGGALFGIPGMLLAFPTAGACKVILDRMLRYTSITPSVLSLPAVPLRHR